MNVVLASPFRFKLLRRDLSGGNVRDLNCLSLFDRQRQRRWWQMVRVQANIAGTAHARDVDQEEAILRDMLEVFMQAFGRVHVPRITAAIEIKLCLDNVSI